MARRRRSLESLMQTAAIYARVSSDQQKEEKTIASQTAALMEFARSEGYGVPDEWVVQDEGYSGANLARPGLERVRDLAAEGEIQTVLALAPDRLSRKYAYQVLLIEELARHGVEVVFVNAPQTGRPEDQLLLQFQGMIAEYERAQILERSRRGKRHRAKQGEISVLSAAPYGYRYRRKSEEHPAGYEVIAAEAQVVHEVFDWYTVAGLSIGAITLRLNERGVPTKKGGARWERSTIWAMLRNPAYRGLACFGKTQQAARQRAGNRIVRQRGGSPSARNSATRELPRDQWIQIPVPALVSGETFALAEQRLVSNKKHAARRTIEPSILQGLVHCRHCGYALYRTSTRSSARKIAYYRCLGSDAWRYEGVAKCDLRPIRLDRLEHTVWSEILHLLENPSLIEAELTRRLEAARQSSASTRQHESLSRELRQVQKGMDRLLTGYQEDLLSLEELRRRMPVVRQREQSLQGELHSLRARLADESAYLRLAENLSSFLGRLRANAQTLDVRERQRITRLLVKEVVVAANGLTIRHSIPTGGPSSAGGNDEPSSPPGNAQGAGSDTGYLLCPWRDRPPLRRSFLSSPHNSTVHEARIQPFANQAQDDRVSNPMSHHLL